MSLRNTENRWGSLAQGFHWVILLLIVSAWVAFELHDDAPKGSPERLMWLNYHKALGFSVFFLVWLRLAWRLTNISPKTIIVSVWQERAATAAHWILYALMICMPVSGALMSQYEGHPVSWFGVFTLPTLVAPDKGLGEVFEGLHTEVFWPALLVVVGVHAAAALWHHFVVKDATLRRMLPGAKD
jgi:cytochrome b561